MTQLKVNLQETRLLLRDPFNSNIKESNSRWEDLIRLIITLSSTFLILTIAMVEKLFPATAQQPISPYLIVSWSLFFSAVVLGIATQINEIIFHGNQCREVAIALKECDDKIAAGLEDEIIDMPDSYIKNNSIGWGVACINCFMFSIVFLCLAFLSKTLAQCICLLILLIVSVALIFMNLHFLSIREK